MSMRGVVIWYSRSDFRAIIWCEDSKDLGIASGPTAWRNPMVKVEIGDCVAFRTEQRGRDRLCRDIHVIEVQSAPHLPEAVLAARPKAIVQNPLLHLCASRD